MIGKWLKRSGNRAKVIVATKVGIEMGPGRKGLSRKRILSACEESLGRLQTDYIDLYQSHTDDVEAPFEETLGAYAELIQQGKVRTIGASNYKADRLAAALDISNKNGLPHYATLQPEYSLAERQAYEAQLEPLCERENLGVINYFPLASGFLTGKYRSEQDLEKSSRGQFVKKYFNERGFKIVEALYTVANKHSATPAQVALAWCLARPSITAPIASATNLDQLRDLIGAVSLRLDSASIDLLDQASVLAANPASAS